MSTNFYSHAKKKITLVCKNLLMLQNIFLGVLICLGLTKTFYQKKIVVTNLCIPSQSQYEVVMNLIWFTV